MEPIADLIAASIDDLLIDHVIYVRGRPGRIVSLDFPLVFWQFDGEEVVKHRSFNASRALFQVSAADAAANASAAAAKSKRSASLDSSSDSSDDHDDWASFENAPPLPDNSPPNSTESSSVAASTASVASFDDGFDDSELDFAAVGVDKVEAVEPAPAAEPVSSPSDLASKLGMNFARKEFVSDRSACTIPISGRLSTVLHIENCNDAVIVVTGKVNSITVVKCSNLLLHFDAVVSSCSVFRSQRVRLACHAPSGTVTFAVELSSDVSVRFPAALGDALITSIESDACTLIAASTSACSWPTSHEQLSDSLEIDSSDLVHVPTQADKVREVLSNIGAAKAQLYTRWNGIDFHTEIAERTSISGYVANLPS